MTPPPFGPDPSSNPNSGFSRQRSAFSSYGQPPRWRRFFGSDNPFMWSLPFGSLFRISIRVSILYIIWMAIQLAQDHQRGTLTFGLWTLGSLLVIVLLHEFGHCFACRYVGGQANDVLLWPLGGLASCNPPHNWWAHFVTTAGGPLVNLLLIPVFASAMILAGLSWSQVIYNPFQISQIASNANFTSWFQVALFYAHFANIALLAFNVLLPMYPMDGGRLLQALLWKQIGYSRSMMIATTIGIACAIIVGIYAVASGKMILLGIAILGGLTCVQQRAQLRMMATANPYSSEDNSSDWYAQAAQAQAAKREAKDRQSAKANALRDSQELDRILAKIKAQGMASLTSAEERFLKNRSSR